MRTRVAAHAPSNVYARARDILVVRPETQHEAKLRMATASVSEVQCSLLPALPQGVLRPTISSARRRSRSLSAELGGVVLSCRVPSLPKLHGRGPLTSTKLCEAVSMFINACFFAQVQPIFI